MNPDEVAKDLVKFLNLPRRYIACWVSRKHGLKPVVCIAINPDYIKRKELQLPTLHLGYKVSERTWSAPATGETLRIAQQWVAK